MPKKRLTSFLTQEPQTLWPTVRIVVPGDNMQQIPKSAEVLRRLEYAREYGPWVFRPGYDLRVFMMDCPYKPKYEFHATAEYGPWDSSMYFGIAP